MITKKEIEYLDLTDELIKKLVDVNIEFYELDSILEYVSYSYFINMVNNKIVSELLEIYKEIER